MMVRWCLVALCAVVAYANAIDSNRFQPKKPRSDNSPGDGSHLISDGLFMMKSFPADLQPGQPDSDEMVSNLLQWIQGLYQQKNRKARQYFGGKPEKPRPFEPASYLPPVTGYPPSGSRPTPSYSEEPSQPSSPFLPSQPPYRPSKPDQPPIQPSQPPYKPSQPGYQPSQPTYPSYEPSQSTQSSYEPSQPNQPSQTPYEPSEPSNPPSYRPSQPTRPSYEPSEPSEPSYQPSQPSQPDYYPSQPSQPGYKPSQSSQPEQPTSSAYQPSQSYSPGITIPSVQTPRPGQIGDNENGNYPQIPINPDDDDRHPPHIHDITVECGKQMMTINIEFNKVYNGIIYSQDHFKDSSCIYVKENSNQIKYSFTVNLNRCGTRFFSDFENEGQAYLENVLVLQNEPGIQEVWDHIRRVRCLWEGNLTKQLVSSLSVGMLNQITSNFSGDTAMARLDIQTGRGPFAPEANGLIKIGEIMTLVVSVTGDAGFDILVRECIARDSSNINVVPLTDANGCVLKPKLFGAFQKTRETGNSGASIIAYAFFNAFKFPDEMDLIIQCEVELCKTDCEVCPSPGSTEPRRRRRDIIHVGNKTYEPVTTIEKSLRVVFAEDLPSETGICISSYAALWGGFLVLVGSLLSSLSVSYCWHRSRGSVKFS